MMERLAPSTTPSPTTVAVTTMKSTKPRAMARQSCIHQRQRTNYPGRRCSRQPTKAGHTRPSSSAQILHKPSVLLNHRLRGSKRSFSNLVNNNLNQGIHNTRGSPLRNCSNRISRPLITRRTRLQQETTLHQNILSQHSKMLLQNPYEKLPKERPCRNQSCKRRTPSLAVNYSSAKTRTQNPLISSGDIDLAKPSTRS